MMKKIMLEQIKCMLMKVIKREAVSDGESKKRLILERLILTEATNRLLLLWSMHFTLLPSCTW